MSDILIDLLFRLVFIAACVYFGLKINRACNQIGEIHQRIVKREKP